MIYLRTRRIEDPTGSRFEHDFGRALCEDRQAGIRPSCVAPTLTTGYRRADGGNQLVQSRHIRYARRRCALEGLSQTPSSMHTVILDTTTLKRVVASASPLFTTTKNNSELKCESYRRSLPNSNRCVGSSLEIQTVLGLMCNLASQLTEVTMIQRIVGSGSLTTSVTHTTSLSMVTTNYHICTSAVLLSYILGRSYD